MSMEELSPLQEALNLLVEWQLPQLCDRFREEEICTVAFRYLTEEDICKLISKIGPASIFRARLQQWRQQLSDSQTVYAAATSTNTNTNNRRHIDTDTDTDTYKADDLSFIQPMKIKEENVDIECRRCEISSVHEPQMLLEAMSLTTASSELYGDNEIETTTLEADALPVRKQYYYNIRVRELLQYDTIGQSIIKFYRRNQTLDFQQRRQLIQIVIGTILKRRINMTSKNFADLAKQIVRMFPTESARTYYVEREGKRCPKGILYNKYLNMGKVWRQDGLLEYRVTRKNSKNKKRNKTG